jgi:hypothetical protein
MSESMAGPEHRLEITIDTYIDRDGDEKPTYAFKLECPDDCARPKDCLLRDWYFPLEPEEIPGVGAFRVRITSGGDLEWEDA